MNNNKKIATSHCSVIYFVAVNRCLWQRRTPAERQNDSDCQRIQEQESSGVVLHRVRHHHRRNLGQRNQCPDCPCHRCWPGMVIVPRLSRKRGTLKKNSFVHLSVRASVTKTLTWLISSEVFMIDYWYLACMILVTSPFYWYHAVTLTFGLLQGLISCQAGDHNSSNLLVLSSSNLVDVFPMKRGWSFLILEDQNGQIWKYACEHGKNQTVDCIMVELHTRYLLWEDEPYRRCVWMSPYVSCCPCHLGFSSDK